VAHRRFSFHRSSDAKIWPAIGHSGLKAQRNSAGSENRPLPETRNCPLTPTSPIPYYEGDQSTTG